MYNYDALNEYQRVDIQSKVSSSTPHSLVSMLLQGVLDKLAKASGAIERQDISERGQAISESIRIIDNLRASLDIVNGGEIANNLASLYDYMERKLVEANAQANEQILGEVVTLINEIKSAWDTISAK
ncbi:MAG: flagellar protein FliS [Pseudohongiella sp.]|nr:MAG: flagellar protein FliS [Pseudohongiella sp.]